MHIYSKSLQGFGDPAIDGPHVIGDVTVQPKAGADMVIGKFASEIPEPAVRVAVEPAAREHIQSQIFKLEGVSDYTLVCRFFNRGSAAYRVTVLPGAVV